MPSRSGSVGSSTAAAAGRVAGSAPPQLPIFVRGAMLLGAAGITLGGVAGTVDWPLVGTFFGACEGGLAGAFVGTAVGTVFAMLGHRSRTRWAARLIPGSITAAAATTGLWTYRGPLEVPVWVAVTLAVIAVVVTGYLGPTIATGLSPGAARRSGLLAGRIVGTVGCLGATLGGIAGLLIGLSRPATVVVAVFEGGVLGGASGGVLGLLAAGVAVLPRLRRRP